MRPRAVTYLLTLLLILVASVSAQQDPPAENVALHKKACDYVAKSEAESILATAVESKADTPFSCRFQVAGFTDRAPNNKQVTLAVWFWSSPQLSRFAEVKRGLVDYRPPSAVLKDLPGIGDVAIWQWVAAGPQGTLYAFKGGTVQVQVDISGLPEPAALENAKALAAKALGSASGTGYAYLGTPKGDATAAATAAAAAAAEASATAKLMQQGKAFSQAPYITESQFLKTVKEVSVTFETEPSLGKYVSSAQQRSAIESELSKYGIAVRPNAPVSLLATVTHHVDVYTKTYGTTASTANGDKYPIHEMSVALKFFVRAGAWRNGKFHLIAASPAYSSYMVDVEEDNDLQKSVYGDHTLQAIQNAFRGLVTDTLESIASDTKPETKAWYVTSWTAQQKASADAEFTRIMSPQTPVDKKQLDGLDAVPELNLEPTTNSDACAPDSRTWNDLWKKAFQRVGLVEKRVEPALLLHHVFSCHFNYGFTPTHYYWLFDTVSLVEYNLVFKLNGNLVRRPGELLFSYHSAHTLEKDITLPTQDYLPRSITDFLVDLATGQGNAPPISATPPLRP